MAEGNPQAVIDVLELLLADKDLEIERLKAELKWFKEKNGHVACVPDYWMTRATDAEAEIERLKAEIVRVEGLRRQSMAMQEGEIQTLRAEVERLEAEQGEVYAALHDLIPYVAVGQTPMGFRAREAARLLRRAEARLGKVVEEAAYVAWKALRDMREDAAASVVSEKIRALAAAQPKEEK